MPGYVTRYNWHLLTHNSYSTTPYSWNSSQAKIKCSSYLQSLSLNIRVLKGTNSCVDHLISELSLRGAKHVLHYSSPRDVPQSTGSLTAFPRNQLHPNSLKLFSRDKAELLSCWWNYNYSVLFRPTRPHKSTQLSDPKLSFTPCD